MRILSIILTTNKLARKLLVFAVTFVVAIAAMSTAVGSDISNSSGDAGGQPDLAHVLHYTAFTAPTVQAVPIDSDDPEDEDYYGLPEPAEPSGDSYSYEPTLPDVYATLAIRATGMQIMELSESAELDDYQAEDYPQTDESEITQENTPTELPVIRFYPPRQFTEVYDTFRYLPDIPLSESLQRYTYMKSREIGFDYVLALALMWQESNFRAGAVSHNTNGTQDSGIMQINDVNRGWLYREMNIYDLMNPYQNIDAGMEILRRLNDAHGEHFAIMAYQLGEAGMLRQVERGVTTSRHVELVYQRRAQLEEMFAALDEAA